MAEIQLAQTGSAIGSVARLTGSATVSRASGDTETARVGLPIFQDDLVETAPDSSIGLSFVDQSSFSAGSSARFQVDTFIYDPGAGGNMSVGLVQGAFSFVSGQIAKSGDDAMVINVPTGTIGIRGTSGAGDEDEVVLLADADGSVGEISVTTSGGTVLLTQPNLGTVFSDSLLPPAPPTTLELTTIQQRFEAALRDLPTPIPANENLQRGQTGQEDTPGQDEPTGDQGDGDLEEGGAEGQGDGSEQPGEQLEQDAEPGDENDEELDDLGEGPEDPVDETEFGEAGPSDDDSLENAEGEENLQIADAFGENDTGDNGEEGDGEVVYIDQVVSSDQESLGLGEDDIRSALNEEAEQSFEQGFERDDLVADADTPTIADGFTTLSVDGVPDASGSAEQFQGINTSAAETDLESEVVEGQSATAINTTLSGALFDLNYDTSTNVSSSTFGILSPSTFQLSLTDGTITVVDDGSDAISEFVPEPVETTDSSNLTDSTIAVDTNIVAVDTTTPFAVIPFSLVPDQEDIFTIPQSNVRIDVTGVAGENISFFEPDIFQNLGGFTNIEVNLLETNFVNIETNLTITAHELILENIDTVTLRDLSDLEFKGSRPLTINAIETNVAPGPESPTTAFVVGDLGANFLSVTGTITDLSDVDFDGLDGFDSFSLNASIPVSFVRFTSFEQINLSSASATDVVIDMAVPDSSTVDVAFSNLSSDNLGILLTPPESTIDVSGNIVAFTINEDKTTGDVNLLTSAVDTSGSNLSIQIFAGSNHSITASGYSTITDASGILRDGDTYSLVNTETGMTISLGEGADSLVLGQTNQIDTIVFKGSSDASPNLVGPQERIVGWEVGNDVFDLSFFASTVTARAIAIDADNDGAADDSLIEIDSFAGTSPDMAIELIDVSVADIGNDINILFAQNTFALDMDPPPPTDAV